MSSSQRIQVACDWSYPQRRGTKYGVAISTRRIERLECAQPASALEQREVITAMLHIVERVVIAGQPDRWPTKASVTLEQAAVQRPAVSHPVPNHPPKLTTPKI